jgi:SAM-dependent methyltransferase
VADHAPDRAGTGLARGLTAFNSRHPWSHNDHFHRWLIRHLPGRRGCALDVGCGRGDLVAALACRFEQVDGVDDDALMTEVAAQRFAGHPGISIRRMPFEEVGGSFDVITMVAVLHHLDFASALAHARQLLNADGRLLVIGLPKVIGATDLIWDLPSLALNPIVGLIKHPHAADEGLPPPFPVAEPTMSYSEIKTAARELLPGVKLRRRLFFRYTLEWTKNG